MMTELTLKKGILHSTKKTLRFPLFSMKRAGFKHPSGFFGSAGTLFLAIHRFFVDLLRDSKHHKLRPFKYLFFKEGGQCL